MELDISDRKKTDPLLVIKSFQELLSLQDPLIKSQRNTPEITQETGISTYDRLWNKNNVFMIHPFQSNKPASVDFSKITKTAKGKLKIYVQNHPAGNHIVKIWRGDELLEEEDITDTKWELISIKFDHEPIRLTAHATDWYCEHSFITYKIEASD